MSTRKVNYTIDGDDHSQEIYVEDDDDDYDVDEGMQNSITRQKLNENSNERINRFHFDFRIAAADDRVSQCVQV